MTITTNYIREITYGEPLIPPPIQFILDTNKNGKFFNGLLPQDIEDKIFNLASTTAVPFKHAPISWKRIMDNTLEELKNCFKSKDLCIELGLKVEKRFANTKIKYSKISYDNYFRSWLLRLGVCRNTDIPFKSNIFEDGGITLVKDKWEFNTMDFLKNKLNELTEYNTFTPSSISGRRHRKYNPTSSCFFATLFYNVNKEQLEKMFKDNGLKWRKSWSIKKCIQALMKV